MSNKDLSTFIFIFASIIANDNFCAALQGVHQKKAIIIGASSGMGKEVAKLLAKEGYTLGLVARRLSLLESLQTELQTTTYTKQIDVTSSNARNLLQELFDEMQGVDLVLISLSPAVDIKIAGTANEQAGKPRLTWQEKEHIFNVCAKGFICMAEVAIEHFMQQGYGHLVGISSASGFRGSPIVPVYSAAKASISNYMQGLNCAMSINNMNILITDVVAGYVPLENSAYAPDQSAYKETPVQEAAKAILAGIKKKKKILYIPSKVRLIAFLLKYLPDSIYSRYFTWL